MITGQEISTGKVSVITLTTAKFYACFLLGGPRTQWRIICFGISY